LGIEPGLHGVEPLLLIVELRLQSPAVRAGDV
jgi:hypothetical protein